ncbi:spore wall synthesis complex protein [Nocardiopsis rhodophaea]|uniref:Spore wall synthesis complex protein n=1 Tax=Nocardiopsis rhodophaea TaxID=280238 RepID=A0ABN2SED4_9ACTN
MPLSEHEQRMLDQIEQALYAEDPKFANTVRQTNPAVHYKRWIIKASIGFVLGVSLLMAGVIFKQPAISAVGFLIMLSCTLWGLSGWRRVVGGAEGAAAPAEGKQPRPERRGMMDRFEERWRRRQEGDH